MHAACTPAESDAYDISDDGVPGMNGGRPTATAIALAVSLADLAKPLMCSAMRTAAVANASHARMMRARRARFRAMPARMGSAHGEGLVSPPADGVRGEAWDAIWSCGERAGRGGSGASVPCGSAWVMSVSGFPGQAMNDRI